jgi:ERCC4-type nuclease
MENKNIILKQLKDTIIKNYKDSKHKVQLIISSKEKDYVKRYFEDLTIPLPKTVIEIEGQPDIIVNNDDEDIYSLVEFRDIKSGDFWILYNGKLLYLFERKTYADLSKSLQDGRSSTQRFGMQHMPIARERTFILVEDSRSLLSSYSNNNNNNNNNHYHYDPITILGATSNAIVKYKMNYLRTIDIGDTVCKMLSLLKKSFEFGYDHIQDLEPYPKIDYTFDPIKTPFVLKKQQQQQNNQNVDVDFKNLSSSSSLNDIEKAYVHSKKKASGVENAMTWYASCLKNIPLMGEKYRSIQNEFPTFNDLFTYLNNTIDSENAKIIRLRDIKLETSETMKHKHKNEKSREGKEISQRKLGPKMAIKLYAWMMNLDESKIKISNSTRTGNVNSKINVNTTNAKKKKNTSLSSTLSTKSIKTKKIINLESSSSSSSSNNGSDSDDNNSNDEFVYDDDDSSDNNNEPKPKKIKKNK